MRKYANMYGRFWTGNTGSLLATYDPMVRNAAAYLISCDQSNIIGMYRLFTTTMARALNIVDPHDCLYLLSDLQCIEFAYYDPGTQYVWVPEMARYQVGDTLALSDDQRTGVLRVLKQHRDSPFYGNWVQRYRVAFNLHQKPAMNTPRTGKKVRRIPLPEDEVWIADDTLKDPIKLDTGPIRGVYPPYTGGIRYYVNIFDVHTKTNQNGAHKIRGVYAPYTEGIPPVYPGKLLTTSSSTSKTKGLTTTAKSTPKDNDLTSTEKDLTARSVDEADRAADRSARVNGDGKVPPMQNPGWSGVDDGRAEKQLTAEQVIAIWTEVRKLKLLSPPILDTRSRKIARTIAEYGFHAAAVKACMLNFFEISDREAERKGYPLHLLPEFWSQCHTAWIKKQRERIDRPFTKAEERATSADDPALLGYIAMGIKTTVYDPRTGKTTQQDLKLPGAAS